MALYRVYWKAANGTVIGDLITTSENTAFATVEGYIEQGMDAWYEQIQ